MHIRENRRHAEFLLRILISSLVLGTLVAVGILWAAHSQTAKSRIGSGAADLDAAEQSTLGSYLSAHAEALATPAGLDTRPIAFAIQPGESYSSVTARLVAEGLVGDARLLDAYLRYYSLDGRIQAGTVILRQTMTIPEIASVLTNPSAREVVVRLQGGWRLEQIAEALSANSELAVSYDDFLKLAGSDGHVFIGDIQPGASLEGFLLPDTYRFHRGATAQEVIAQMLATFQARLPADYRAAVAAHGLTLYEAVTVAALIERETAVSDERPLIASVILNRLAAGRLLEIDATVQYALGTPGNWWPGVGGTDMRAIDSPYNTYYVAGLPAGPIANPGLDSLLAVAHPADTDYLYYRALCDGSGRHAFAATYEEHLANVCH